MEVAAGWPAWPWPSPKLPCMQLQLPGEWKMGKPVRAASCRISSRWGECDGGGRRWVWGLGKSTLPSSPTPTSLAPAT